jgi:ribonuclease VapC
MAILLAEDGSDRLMEAIETADSLSMSAGTLAEALIVAARRSVGHEMAQLVAELGIEIVPLTPVGAAEVAAAHGTWGKGIHPAGLNFGDCFAYALAKQEARPLLFAGNDFSRTDLKLAVAP